MKRIFVSLVVLATTPALADASTIEALVWGFKMEYEAYPANSMVNREYDYTLFKDGSCIGMIPASIDQLDPAGWRAKHPRELCTWKKSGASYVISEAGRSYAAVSNQTVLRGGARGERLTGTWHRDKVGQVATTSTWRGTTLSLGGDGRFSFAAAGAYQMNTDPSNRSGDTTITGAYDKHGSTTNVTGPGGGIAIKSKNHTSAGDDGGTYTFDGYTIELRYDSGKVERLMFAVSTDPKHAFARFGNTIMTRK